MKFCSICERALVRDTSTGIVRFSCGGCGEIILGGDADIRVGGSILGASETTAMYAKLIKTASMDRVNQLVHRICTSCGLDYMTQIRVGESEAIVYTCKCGAIVSGEMAGNDSRLKSIMSDIKGRAS